MLAEAGITAGVGTAIEGGSLVNAFTHALTGELAASGAYAIGDAGAPLPLNILEHAALGCAASAAEGTGCAGGAIGGAVSAGLNPVIDSSGNLPPVALAGIETLVSGSISGALGFNVQGAVTAAQNETLNNFCDHNPCGQGLASGASSQSGNGALNPMGGSTFAIACGGGRPCNTQLLGTLLQAQGANADQALATISPNYATLNVGLLSASAGGAINLADGTKYLAFGVGQSNPSSISWTPGGSATLGWIWGANGAAATNAFLNGDGNQVFVSIPTPLPFNVITALTHGYGGATALAGC
jgi:filamentous hemagglutinin